MAEHHMWAVISPPVLPEYEWAGDQRFAVAHFPEYVEVEAPTKRAAKVAGVKAMTEWPAIARGDDQNPFAGVTVEPLVCGHGVCHCEKCSLAARDGIPCQVCYWDDEGEGE